MNKMNNFSTFLNIIIRLSIILPAIYFVGYNLIENSERRALYYFFAFIVFTLFKIALIAYRSRRPKTFKPTKWIPTYAAGIRATIVMIFAFFLTTDIKSPIVPFLYLLYYAILCSFYDHHYYYKNVLRISRIIIDFCFAGAIFYVYIGSKSITGLAFILPVLIISQYHKITWGYITAFLAVILMLTVSYFYRQLDPSIFTHIGYNFLNNIILTADNSYDLTLYTLKNILNTTVILFLIVIVFHYERSNRENKLYDLTKVLQLWIKKYGRTVNEKLIQYFVKIFNVESIIAMKKTKNYWEIYYCFLCRDGDLKSGKANTLNDFQSKKGAYNNEIKKIENHDEVKYFASITNRFIKKINTSDNIIRTLFSREEKDKLIKKAPKIFEFNATDAETKITFINNLIFNSNAIQGNGKSLLDIRNETPIYQEFKIISCIYTNWYGWEVFIINDLPKNLPITPKRFWPESIEKIQLITTIFQGR